MALSEANTSAAWTRFALSRRQHTGENHAAAADGLGLQAVGHLQTAVHHQALRLQGVVGRSPALGNVNRFHHGLLY